MTTGRWMSVWCVVCGMLAAGAVQAAKTNYVNQLGTNDIPPFTSWDLATSNLQAAINDTITNDTVLVTNGTYWINAEITITNAITVKSVAGAVETVVSRATAYTNVPQHRIFKITGNAVLDGFTVRNGYLPATTNNPGNLGGGINMNAGTLQNCVITTNGIGASWTCGGGGVYMSGSSKMLFCTVVSNFAASGSGGGGGVSAVGNALLISNTISYNYNNGANLANQPTAKFCVFEYNTGSGCYGYTVTLTNCIMRFNTAGQGGGFFGVNGNTVLDCTIVSNTATAANGGGGVYLNGAYSPLLFRRCVISANTNANYPGIFMDVGYDPACSRIFELCRVTDNRGKTSVGMLGRPEFVRFRNCTISAPLKLGVEVLNLATNPAGAYLYPTFQNTIVFGHATNIFSTNAAVFSFILTNSFTNCCSPQLTEPGFNNVAADPAFVAPASWNYHLKRFSPCARTGSTNVFVLYKSDLEQVPFGKTVNMGCYETLTPYAGGTVVTVR